MVIAGALERFRWAVRFIRPTLVLTGLIQALPYTGLPPAGLTGSLFGLLILFKLALIVGLVVIFITCPLWRAFVHVRRALDALEPVAVRARLGCKWAGPATAGPP